MTDNFRTIVNCKVSIVSTVLIAKSMHDGRLSLELSYSSRFVTSYIRILLIAS